MIAVTFIYIALRLFQSSITEITMEILQKKKHVTVQLKLMFNFCMYIKK